MPSGADENDSFEKDEELANGIFSKLGAGVRPGGPHPFSSWLVGMSQDLGRA